MTHASETACPAIRIAVLIVNYGTADLAIRAVNSVLSQSHRNYAVELHLVDNASPNGDAARLAATHAVENWGSRVTLWPEETNHGFARGNNIVLHALAEQPTPPEYVFLLNPDAWIEGEAIAALADLMQEKPSAGAVGGGNFNADGVRDTAAFRFPNVLGELERTVNFGPVSRLLNKFRVPLPPEHPAGQVDWVSGASVMFRFTALRKVRFFNPGFFLYYEEVDLMRRLKAAGWEVHYFPEARILHVGQAATGVSEQDRQPAYLYRSWRRYFSHSGRPYALVAATSIVIGSFIGVIISRVLRRPGQVPVRFFRDHWHYVASPLLGLRSDAIYDTDSRQADEQP